MQRSVFVLLATLALVATSCGAPPEEVESGAPGEAAEGWERLPDAPIPGRAGALMAELDGRTYVFGGDTHPGCHDTIVHQAPSEGDGPGGGDGEAPVRSGAAQVVLASSASAAASCVAPEVDRRRRDGAVLDVGSREWSAMADAPVPMAAPSTTAVVGGRIYVLTAPTFHSSTPDFAVYDPATDSWTELPSPPPTERAYFGLVAAGGRLVALHVSQESGQGPDFVFDPDAGQWSSLPLDPLAPSFDRAGVWTGAEMVLLGVEVPADYGDSGPHFVRAAALDPATSTWRRLPDSELLGGYAEWWWAGERVVNAHPQESDGGQTNNYGRRYPSGGMLDPRSGEWSELPEGRPREYTPAPEHSGCTNDAPWLGLPPEDNAAGSDVVVQANWALHVREGRWEQIACNPDRADFSSAVVWAGPGLLTFGGYDVVAEQNQGPTDFEFRNDAWLWRPAATRG